MFWRPLPTESPAPLAACPNCGAGLAGLTPPARYCPACGQETTILPPTVREFAQQFGGAYVSTEGALWRTLKLLLIRPGELTVQYLAGRRKHYVLPLRLYLTISLVALLMVRIISPVELIGGLDESAVHEAERAGLPRLVLNVGGLKLGVRDGVFICEQFPAALCEVVQARATPDARTFLHRLRMANQRVQAHLGTMLFVLLPLFAVCLRVVHWRTGMGYTSHLVFALHLHAFWFLVLPFMALGWAPLNWILGTAMLLYTLSAGRRVYGGLWWQRILPALLLSVMYMTLLLTTVLVAWLTALLA